MPGLKPMTSCRLITEKNDPHVDRYVIISHKQTQCLYHTFTTLKAEKSVVLLEANTQAYATVTNWSWPIDTVRGSTSSAIIVKPTINTIDQTTIVAHDAMHVGLQQFTSKICASAIIFNDVGRFYLTKWAKNQLLPTKLRNLTRLNSSTTFTEDRFKLK